MPISCISAACGKEGTDRCPLRGQAVLQQSNPAEGVVQGMFDIRIARYGA